MKIILVLCYFNLVQIIHSRKYFLDFDDEFLPYHLDKRVTSYKEFYSTENFIFERIDDENVLIGGYIEWRKSMNRSLPIRLTMQTEYLKYGIWDSEPFKIILVDSCKEFVNPKRFSYNITKLFTSDVCPPRDGDKWIIEEQQLNLILDIPSSRMIGQWRIYYLLTQGVAKFESYKYGFGMQVELHTM